MDVSNRPEAGQARKEMAAIQRSSARDSLGDAEKQRLSGEERGATWGDGSSAETVQVIGRRGQDLPRVQNVMEGQCWKRGITARGLWRVESGEISCGDQGGLLRRH